MLFRSAIAREGRAGPSPEELAPDFGPLFRAIVEHVPPPVANLDGPVQVLVSALDYDPHRGRIAIGRVIRGTLAKGMSVRCLGGGPPSAPLKLLDLYTFAGLGRLAVDQVRAGDVVAIPGMPSVTIGDTVADAAEPEALPRLAITEQIGRAHV